METERSPLETWALPNQTSSAVSKQETLLGDNVFANFINQNTFSPFSPSLQQVLELLVCTCQWQPNWDGSPAVVHETRLVI